VRVALPTVFPGPATVESNVSALKREHDEFRSTLTERSLEGIKQCKQFNKVNRVVAPPALRGLTGNRSDFKIKWYNLPDRSKFSIFGVFAGFGKQISLGVFGTDFGSDIMTIYLQLSKSERKVSCFWQSKTT
jgi:hypothetical protein